MPVNPELNKILKEVWRIDEKFMSGEILDPAEKEFLNEHIPTIQKYYRENGEYWNSKKPL